MTTETKPSPINKDSDGSYHNKQTDMYTCTSIKNYISFTSIKTLVE